MLHKSMNKYGETKNTPISAIRPFERVKNPSYRVLLWSPTAIVARVFIAKDNARAYADSLRTTNASGENQRILMYRGRKVLQYWEWQHVGQQWKDMIGSMTRSGHYRLKKAT